VLLPPATHGDFDARIGAVPEVGEHTEKILLEVGLSATEIAELKAENAISFERRKGK
jgi:crotonobetainyl-CoA:carnitine CoA-transferase CaiB-like acyl-CoA transferase